MKDSPAVIFLLFFLTLYIPRPNLRLENPDACQTDALLCLSDAVWYDSIAAARK